MWNPEEQINKVLPAFERMMLRLNKLGIKHSHTGLSYIVAMKVGAKSNVTFWKDEKHIYVSCHSVFRFSGIASITRDVKGEKNQSETVPITDDDYMSKFMEPIIKTLLDKA